MDTARFAITIGCCLLAACARSAAPPPAVAKAPLTEHPQAAGAVFDVTAAPFFARGDGVSDDSEPIQRAIHAAVAWGRRGAGALVRIPSGTYRVTRQLELADDAGQPARGLVVVGDGPASFLAFDHKMADGHGDALRGLDARDLVIRDLRIGAVPGGAGFNRGIVLNGGTHVVLRDLDISGAWLDTLDGKPFGYPSGIFIDGGLTDVRILDNELHDNGNDDGNSWHIVVYASGGASQVRIHGNRCITAHDAAHRANFGIGVYNSTYAVVDGNEVDGVTGTRRDTDGYGIMLYGGAMGLSHHHTVTGNTIRHTGGAGIYVQNSPYTVVSNNLLEDTARSQSSTSLTIGAIGFNLGPGTISGNVIHGVGVDSLAQVAAYGIAIQTCGASALCARDDGTPRGIAVSSNAIEQTANYGIAIYAGPSRAADNSTIVGNTLVNTRGGVGTVGGGVVTGLIITGNSIVRTPYPASDSAPGIFLDSAVGSVIANNVVVGARSHGILLYKDASRNIVAGNVVRDFSRLKPGDYPGIQVSGLDNLITGNQIYTDGAGGHSWGVIESGTANDILFNDVVGSAGVDRPGVLSTGVHSVRAHNRSSNDKTESGPEVP